MPFFQRRSTRPEEAGRPVFLTWTLEAGLCRAPRSPLEGVSMGGEFESVDRLMDEARSGPLYLRDRETAAMVVHTLKSQAQSLRQFELNAYVVMPNHVHLLITPQARLADLTAHLQHLIAKRAGDLLELQGAPFWSAHNYEHLITNWMEQERIRLYIEHNPVRSGLASKPSDYAFSSAALRHVEPVMRLAAAS